MNNKGFSLIELVIVIAIMAIVTAGSIAGFGYLRLADSKKCTMSVDESIETLYSQTMAKANKPYMYLYELNGDTYVKITSSSFVKDTDAKKVGNSSIPVVVDGKDLSSVPGGVVKIGYSRSDGAFDTPTSNMKIVVGTSKKYTINIVSNTGRHYVQR